MKVGDLVQVQKWCKSRGRIAYIIDEFWYDPGRVMIQFLDPEGIVEEPCEALKTNLILVSSA